MDIDPVTLEPLDENESTLWTILIVSFAVSYIGFLVVFTIWWGMLGFVVGIVASFFLSFFVALAGTYMADKVL